MRSAQILGAIMAVGCAAVPLDQRAVKVVEVVDVVTVTVKPGQPLPTSSAVAVPPPTTTPAAATTTPAAGSFLENKPAPVPAPAPAPKPAPVPAPAPAPKPVAPSSPSTPSTSDDQAGMLSVVNFYRKAYGLNELSWNDNLASNVAQVGSSNGGVNENHTLMPGVAMGQVITPGQSVTFPAGATTMSPFEIAYLAWLCEVDTDPELQASANNGVDMCGVMQSILHMEYDGTGHHDIIVSPVYTGVNCQFTANPASGPDETYQGIWVCDFSQ